MTGDRPRQLPLGLPARGPRYGRSDFVVSESNKDALDAAEAFMRSGHPVLCVCGPPQSGKTHIITMLAQEAGGCVVQGAKLGSVPASARVVAVDVVEQADERALFALIDSAAIGGRKLLLAGAGAVESWAKGSIDLRTRLSAAPRIALAEPGEALLTAVIAKQLCDRQLRAGDEIARYAAPRLSKTFAAAALFVDALDALALEEGSPVSVRLARKVVANLSEALPDPYSPVGTEETGDGRG